MLLAERLCSGGCSPIRPCLIHAHSNPGWSPVTSSVVAGTIQVLPRGHRSGHCYSFSQLISHQRNALASMFQALTFQTQCDAACRICGFHRSTVSRGWFLEWTAFPHWHTLCLPVGLLTPIKSSEKTKLIDKESPISIRSLFLPQASLPRYSSLPHPTLTAGDSSDPFLNLTLCFHPTQQQARTSGSASCPPALGGRLAA